MLTVLLIALLGLGLAYYVSGQRQKRAIETKRASALDGPRKLAEEDVTVFGEELQVLHIDTMTTELDTAMRQDYQRALNSYETAKSRLANATEREHITAATTALEDGRYAMACVLARQNGDPLPIRRPPCFFNPQHGPSTLDMPWAPPGGEIRDIPVCEADADRVRQGAEPDIRTIDNGYASVPYWRGGADYQPYAMGYFSAYASMMPAFFAMTMLNSMWMGGMMNDFGTEVDTGSGDVGGGDSGGDMGGGDAGGGDGGGWFGGDGGGDGGGFFDGGGFDFGGFGE